VTEAEILAVLPDVTVYAGGAGGMDGTAAPGTRHRHYQPNAEVYLYDDLDQLQAYLGRRAVQVGGYGVIIPAGELERWHSTVGRAASGSARATNPGVAESAVVIRSYADLREYARSLYAWFDEFDKSCVREVFAHLPPGTGLATALRDRLIRAGGGRRIGEQ
jgi:hypothetical protein